MTPEQKELEINILVALMKATIEQSSFLIGELKYKPKQAFNIWQKQGDLLMLELEKSNIKNVEYIEALTDVIHNIIHGVRDESLKK